MAIGELVANPALGALWNFGSERREWMREFVEFRPNGNRRAARLAATKPDGCSSIPSSELWAAFY